MNPVRIAGVVLGTIALLLFAVLAVGFLLPGGWEVERSARIDAPPEVVFPFVARAAAWEAWTPSPESGSENFGPEEGPGSGRRWDDEGYGQGEFVITATTRPHEVRYAVSVEDGAIRIEGILTLAANDGGTRIVWEERGDFGWNPLLGYLAGRMESLQGAQLEASLASLARLVEGSPVEGS